MEKTTFEILVSKTTMKERSRRMAYGVLVEGKRAVEIAISEGVSRQLVEQAVRRVVRQQKLIEGVPEDWQAVTVTLPTELADSVRWISAQARVDAGVVVKNGSKRPDLSAGAIEMLADLMVGGGRAVA